MFAVLVVYLTSPSLVVQLIAGILLLSGCLLMFHTIRHAVLWNGRRNKRNFK